MDSAVVHYRGGHAAQVFIWSQRFRAMELPDGVLQAPVLCGIDRDAARPRIDFSAVQVPAKLVGFAAVKSGSFQAHGAMGDTNREHVVDDMGRVFEVMT